MRISTYARSSFYVYGTLSLFLGFHSALAYQVKPITVFNDPVAPPILDKDGDGFCVASQKVQYYNDFAAQQTWDAGSIFGNELYFTSPLVPSPSPFYPYRAIPNTQTEGLEFAQDLNNFFDHKFAPDFVRSGNPSLAKFDQLFDLSERPTGSVDQNGDYSYTPPFAPGCDEKGCRFPTAYIRPDYNPNFPAPFNSYKDTRMAAIYPEASSTDPFRDRAFRFAGFLNIPPSLVNKIIVFGVYADDSISIIISDTKEQHVLISATNNRCELCINSNVCKSKNNLGNPFQCLAYGGSETDTSCGGCNPILTGQRWRISNWIKFTKPGMYPMKILYAQFAGSAALEVSMKIMDTINAITGAPIVYDNWGFPHDGKTSDQTYDFLAANSLKDKGFVVMDPKKWVFTSTTGIPQSCTLNQCIYIPNEFPPPNQCPSSDFCNEAGLCEPCDEKNHCGGSCTKCREDAPVCGDVSGMYSCVQCNRNSDCKASQTCGTDHKCHCQEDANCPKGELCQGTVCVRGITNDSCAGNSGLCCQGGTSCVVTETGNPTCVVCNTIKDCTDKFPNDNKTCDPVNHQCVDSVPPGNNNNSCGPNKVICPKDRPYCYQARVCIQCRSDLDCGDGLFCEGGNCGPCTEDKKCGFTCHKCPTDKPFCDGRQGAEFAKCVGCLSDSDCGPLGKCDQSTAKCQNTCTVSCAPGQYCKGDRCVECLSSAQCNKVCGQFCDPDTNTCQGGGNILTGMGGGTPGGGGDGGGSGGQCLITADCLSTDCCVTRSCLPGPCIPNTTLNGGALCCNASSPFSISSSKQALLFFSIGLFLSGILVLLLSYFRRLHHARNVRE